MPSGVEFLLVGAAGVAAGAVNALAGGGTLISFPTLMMIGVPAIAANVTSTVALFPGYLGAALAQAADLRGQQARFWLLAPAALGGIAGGALLLHTDERLFRNLVPFLILLASGLLAAQDPLRAWLARRAGATAAGKRFENWALLPVGLAAVYGGYFGAGLSVIVLAVLALMLDDSLTRLNALKQTLALAVNIAAAGFLLFSGQVVWSAALVMAIGALAGGAIGGRIAGRIEPTVLRRVVVTLGVVIAIIYLRR